MRQKIMLLMITRHCSPRRLRPLASLPLLPWSPQHLLPAWLLSTTPFCAHRVALLLAALAKFLPTAPGQACCCRQEQGRNSKKNTFCISKHGWRLRCYLGQDDSVKVHCEDGREPLSISCRSCFEQCCWKQLWYGG